MYINYILYDDRGRGLKVRGHPMDGPRPTTGAGRRIPGAEGLRDEAPWG